MSNSQVKIVEASIDGLFDIAAADPVLPEVFSRVEASGQTVEGLFVPFGIAVRAIPELANYRESTWVYEE